MFQLLLYFLKVFGDEAMDTKISEIKHENLGEVGEVVVTKDDTLFLKGKGDSADLQARCDQIKQEVEETSSEYEKEKLNERLAKLSDGVAIIKVSNLFFGSLCFIVNCSVGIYFSVQVH